ncbi:hypothetical protein [Pseudomonas sp. MWU13-2105]|uniref:hypothetical protein n=1 Tax=Pseudomonas sp. MWU13-2105 TaxID=2935074 RepID=UPI0020108176|nr:hypothetical protein [Pseudomonas sp. MWU13-2105]
MRQVTTRSYHSNEDVNGSRLLPKGGSARLALQIHRGVIDLASVQKHFFPLS